MGDIRSIGFPLTVLLFLLFVGCNGGNHRGFTDIKTTATKQLDFDSSVFMQYPYRVRVLHDSMMYLTDLHGKEFFCHQFAFPSLKYRKSFAPRGKAPDELLSLSRIITDDSTLYLLDTFAKKIYQWNGQETSLFAELPVDMGLPVDFAMLDDSTFIFPDFSGESRLIFVNRSGIVVRETGMISDTEHAGSPKAALGQAWRSFISYNRNNGIVALATQLGDVLEIYHLNHDKQYITVGSGGEPKFRQSGGKASPAGIMGYGDVFVGDRYIYAVYWGHEMDKIKSGEITEEGGNMFRVFDFEGNPVRQYLLDCHITGFCVNEKTNEVVGTDVNNGQLVVFGL